MSFRRIVSLTLFFSLAVMLTSSIILFIVPQGRVAYWAGWTLWGLSKSQWGGLHTNSGFLMVIAGLFHVYYNWRPITSYLKNKSRQIKVFTPNFNMALAVSAVVVAGTIAEIPPFVWIQDLRVSLEEGGVKTFGNPPYGHAEQSSLKNFVRNVGLDLAQVRKNLAQASLVVPSDESTIEDLAHQAKLTPQALFEIMQGFESASLTEPQPIPETMPRGTGRKTLEQFCAELNLDVGQATQILLAAGISVGKGQIFRDIAQENGRETLDLLDLLREGFAVKNKPLKPSE